MKFKLGPVLMCGAMALSLSSLSGCGFKNKDTSSSASNDNPDNNGSQGGDTANPGEPTETTTTTTTTTTTMPPSPPTPDPSACTTEVGTIAAGTLSVSEPATSSKTVILSLFHEETNKMRVSHDDHCGCGNWENYSSTKVWTLTRLNQNNPISVQFRDYDGRFSACTSLSVLHDDQAPQITLSLDPANTYEAGTATKVNLAIGDLGVGVQSQDCQLDGVRISCSAGNSILVFDKQLEGNHSLAITAKDKLGQASNQSVSWTVKKVYQQITQDYTVQGNNKVDILLIDDNSSSMAYEQKSMAQRMSTFLNQLSGLDWRIAITTTDPDSNVVWGDGQLLEMVGLKKQTYISSSMDFNDANKALAATVQRSEAGSPSEQGIFATYRSIERSLLSGNNPNKQFFRNDANFAAIVISDEDESDTQYKNKPENLLSFVKTTWPSKNFAFHSIITRPGDQACLRTDGYSYGVTYDRMSRLTGAGMIGGPIIGSVCEADYGGQLKGIGDSVQAMQKMIQLKCAPIGNANSSVMVTHNGGNYTDPYTVQGDRLLFASSLPQGKYTLQYQCP